MQARDWIILGAVGAAGWYVYTNREKFNIFSDKNVAFTTAEKVAKLVGGENATVTDIVPGINKYDPNTPSDLLAKPSAVPSAAAPYWYERDGSKRTYPTSRLATAWDYKGRVIVIIDKATQRAVVA